MRLIRKNKQKMYYSTQGEQTPVYATDEDGNIKYYTDSDGNEYPLEDGYTLGYSEPVEFYGNISMSGGEAEAQEFGLSVSDFDAVLILPKGKPELTETSLIWFTSEILYKDEELTEVDAKSADFAVKRVSDSLNMTKVLLQKVTK